MNRRIAAVLSKTAAPLAPVLHVTLKPMLGHQIYGESLRRMRTLFALGAFALLAGCNAEQALVINAKANKPVAQKLIEASAAKDMDALSPILLRIFKQEAELEIWKQDKSGRFALLTTLPICRWSGDLGPKIKEGDRQAPEGFYSVTPSQMNPESQLYLSFNLGFPNAFDRSFGRTGSHLMVHGDCTSSGCYAMTDEQMSDIYALARESFFGGQKSIQVQAYPFRMTPSNLAKHRNNPHMAFWKMLKQGNDQFEVSHLEPTVDVCEKRYVFGASKQSEQAQFLPTAKCPPYSAPEEIAQISKKQQKDEMLVAELVSRGIPVAPQNLGIDGGMHALFAAKVSNGNTGISDSNSSVLSATMSVASVPPGVNPPRSKQTVPFGAGTFSSVEEDGRFRSGDSSSSASGASVGIFGKLARQMGIVDAPAADKTAKKDSAPKKGNRPGE